MNFDSFRGTNHTGSCSIKSRISKSFISDQTSLLFINDIANLLAVASAYQINTSLLDVLNCLAGSPVKYELHADGAVTAKDIIVGGHILVNCLLLFCCSFVIW